MREFLDISHLLGMPEAASAHAADIDYMMALVHWLMLLLFIGWGGYFLYVLYRFRASKNPVASYDGAKGTFSKVQEIAVVVVESVLLVGFAFPIWGLLKNEFPVANTTFEVHVIAEQFTWNIHYPGPDGVFGPLDPYLVNTATNPIGLVMSDSTSMDDIVLIDELHLPVDRPVTISLSSKDVIHSFGVPELRVKQDIIPGLIIPIWFTPTLVGEYEIACAQLCGIGHYKMKGYVTVEPMEDVDAWLEDMASGAF